MTILVRFFEDAAKIYDNIQEITSTQINDYVLHESNGNVTILPKCNIESIHIDSANTAILDNHKIFKESVKAQ
jgi:hypothetical protein